MQPDIMHCMFSLVQTHALGGSKHGLCIDDWRPNQIKGEGEESTGDILPLTSVPLSLCSPLTAASLEGRAAEAFYCNEEKCINLAGACVQIERRVGEGAPSESFFLIKDGISERVVVSLASSVESAAFLPAAPSGPGSLSLPSVSPHQQGSHGGQVLPPWCCIQCNTSC